jgi:5-formyltetrahydrofolate cyclo-ligase
LVHATAASAKTALRLAMRTSRRALAAEAPDAAGLAAALAMASALSAEVVAGYHPQGGEMDPGPLIRALAAKGARAVLPRAARRDAPLRFHAADDPTPKTPDAYGVPAPAASAEILTPDLVIVPLLAFDARGGRLGQGAGCYDRTLADLRSRGAVWVLGLAYAGQEVAKVPAEDHDQLLDAVLTEKAYRTALKDI